MCAINSDSRFVLFINLLNSSALISKYNLNESRHTELTIYCGPAQVRDAIHIQRVTDWVEGKCKVSGLPGGLRFSGDKWGLFSLLLLLFYSFIYYCGPLNWIRIESLRLVLQKFIPIRIGNLWKLFCGQLQLWTAILMGALARSRRVSVHAAAEAMAKLS